MAENSEGTGRVMGNVGVLDLRKATEESVARIARVSNVGVILVSPETAALAGRIDALNLGAVIEVPPDARFINAPMVIGRDYFKGVAEPVDLVVNGPVLIEPDVPADDIEKGLGSLYLNAPLTCPENVAGAVQAKIRLVNAPIRPYAPGDRLIMGRLTIDETYLRAIGDPITLVVNGRVSLPKVVPNDLLTQKLAGLHVYGRVTCHEENAEALYSLMGDTAGEVRMRIIPAGFEMAGGPLVLDNARLGSLSASRLYCTDRIEVDPEVDGDLLDAKIEGLATDDMILCPAGLKQVVTPKLATLDTRAVFYEGELWLVEDDQKLVGSRFDFTEGKATVVVTGNLAIDPDIEPSVLADRLHKVHNLGNIGCTREQMGAIQARLGISDGNLGDSARSEDADVANVGNAGYLIL